MSYPRLCTFLSPYTFLPNANSTVSPPTCQFHPSHIPTCQLHLSHLTTCHNATPLTSPLTNATPLASPLANATPITSPLLLTGERASVRCRLSGAPGKSQPRNVAQIPAGTSYAGKCTTRPGGSALRCTLVHIVHWCVLSTDANTALKSTFVT